MIVPFIKAQGAGNDFLFTYAQDLPADLPDPRFPLLAKAICDRRAGVGADGWYLIRTHVPKFDAAVRLWNSDGSYAELSGNGTRCAAAILLKAHPRKSRIHLQTGAGPMTLELIERTPSAYRIRMALAEPLVQPGMDRYRLPVDGGLCDVTIVDVGNPQCAVPVDTMDFDWRDLGARIEGHPHFTNRTNVSFFRRLDDNVIEARFFERGAGPTLSSGTGATGAAIASIVRGLAKSPVTVQTEGAPLEVAWDGKGSPALLTGPAQIIASGTFDWMA